MCLYTQQTDAKEAKAPIICYKIARLITEPASLGCTLRDPVLRSLYYEFSYRLNRLYRCNDFKTSVKDFVYEGFHSYKNEVRAQMECDPQDEVVLKCRIPRGAMYFEGDNPHQYCSDRIEILGWRYGIEKPGKWHFKGGNALQTKRSLMDVLRNLFKSKKEE